MKAVRIIPGKIIEYFGEIHTTPDVRQEVEVLQFVKDFWGSKAICRVGNRIEEISTKELEVFTPEELKELGV